MTLKKMYAAALTLTQKTCHRRKWKRVYMPDIYLKFFDVKN